MQVAEGTFVQALRMFTCSREPPCNRGLPKAEDAFSRGSIQPLGQRGEHHGDLLGRRFQPVQRRIPSRTEGRAAGLTPMCVVCQEGKNLPFFDCQSGLKTKNHAS